MTDEQVDQEIASAKQRDGTYSMEWVKKMNEHGIWFEFHIDGIRWKRTPFI